MVPEIGDDIVRWFSLLVSFYMSYSKIVDLILPMGVIKVDNDRVVWNIICCMYCGEVLIIANLVVNFLGCLFQYVNEEC